MRENDCNNHVTVKDYIFRASLKSLQVAVRWLSCLSGRKQISLKTRMCKVGSNVKKSKSFTSSVGSWVLSFWSDCHSWYDWFLLIQVGQAPVCLKKEIDGFALNRVQAAIIAESWRLVQVSVWAVVWLLFNAMMIIGSFHTNSLWATQKMNVETMKCVHTVAVLKTIIKLWIIEVVPLTLIQDFCYSVKKKNRVHRYQTD